MMMPEVSYQEALALSEHYKAIGVREIYLSDTSGEVPWKDVIDCEPGGTHRLDMDTNVWFTAIDPKTRLHFRWSFEIEKAGVNGAGSYEIDTNGCRYAMRSLKGEAKEKFRKYLALCATKVSFNCIPSLLSTATTP